MKTHLTEEELITYLEAGKKDQAVTDHLVSCRSCQNMAAELQEIMQVVDQSPEAEPPPGVRWAFDAALEAEKLTLDKASSGFAYWQIAAAGALLVVGFFAGKLSAPDQSEKVIALQSQVELLKELSMVNTLQSHTASERIKAVNMIEEDKSPRASEKLIKTLVLTLNTDESPNVRYAAAQALNRFTGQESVRLALSESLERQDDPLIQILLISMLVEAQEKTAIKPIKDLMERDSVTPEVKKQAKVAIEILT